MSSPKKSNLNHLKNEKSPYLQQHVDNPVDWYPWGNLAFEKAKKENKPIFLSIGYSTCHWCHVMARESFQDPEVGKLMNQVFVPIKVDREERPDIDHIYMTVCQMMTGAGGWPLTIMLTPELKPFFAGTYFPKESLGPNVGLKDLIMNIKEMWEEKGDEILNSADDITKSLQKFTQHRTSKLLNSNILDKAYNTLHENYDEKWGGFGGYQKFPTPHNLLFLLRYYWRTNHTESLKMVEHTLDIMRRGGIWDHVGFGFHRYTIDPYWIVPHFEKMLYDQALLCLAYTEAYLATHKSEYRDTAEKILIYLNRDMRSTEGGYYSAEDADSEGIEGKFYLWSREELLKLLTPYEADLTMKVYGITDGGNFHEESTGQSTGSNILYLQEPLEDTAKRMTMDANELRLKLEFINHKLFQERTKRVRPHLDDKIMTDWNGLMVAALAKASQAFNENKYSKLAEDTVAFIQNEMYQEGHLWHRYREGEVKIRGLLDDYAYLIWGLLELHQATQKTKYLIFAEELWDTLKKEFWDDEQGGFFFTSTTEEELIIRKKEIYDSAIPSGNSVLYWCLLRLSVLLEDEDLKNYALKIEEAFSTSINRSPTGFTMFLCGIDFREGPSMQAVLVGDENETQTINFLKAFRRFYHPRVVWLVNQKDEWLQKRVNHLNKKIEVDEEPTAYICGSGTCYPPATNCEELLKILKREVSN